MASHSVGLAEIKFSKNKEDVIVAHGLGSCIGVVVYDKLSGVGGMAHIVLPSSSIQKEMTTPERFADTGLPILFNKFALLGGKLGSSTTVKIAGGANMFKSNAMSLMDIGGRNIAAVKEILAKMNITIAAMDVGGTNGRTVTLHIATGRVTSRMIGMQEKEL